MNRLQKKCFVGSAGIHLLLALILFIGPGFISSRSKPDDLSILNFVPAKTVDELVAPGGGNPNVKPSPVAVQPPPIQPPPMAPPPAPAPQARPQPQKTHEPDPAPEVKPAAPEEESLEPAKERKKKIEISTTVITRKRETSDERQVREEAQAKRDAKALADARRRLARQIGRAADSISSEISDSTSVVLPDHGPGGGGPSYANFLQSIKSIYANAWLLPDGVVDNEATTVASVTIARDGTVIRYEITQFSRDPVVDHSVQATLERVRKVPPLPDTTAEEQRTVTIYFNVKAKRLMG